MRREFYGMRDREIILFRRFVRRGIQAVVGCLRATAWLLEVALN